MSTRSRAETTEVRKQAEHDAASLRDELNASTGLLILWANELDRNGRSDQAKIIDAQIAKNRVAAKLAKEQSQ